MRAIKNRQDIPLGQDVAVLHCVWGGSLLLLFFKDAYYHVEDFFITLKIALGKQIFRKIDPRNFQGLFEKLLSNDLQFPKLKCDTNSSTHSMFSSFLDPSQTWNEPENTEPRTSGTQRNPNLEPSEPSFVLRN